VTTRKKLNKKTKNLFRMGTLFGAIGYVAKSTTRKNGTLLGSINRASEMYTNRRAFGGGRPL
jgi:hypothetical protein